MNTKMQTKNIRIWALLLCIPLVLAGCESTMHRDEPGGLSVSLAWQDAEESASVNDIRLWIFSAADGSLVKGEHFSDAKALSAERYTLEKGEYKVVVAVNLTSPFSAENESTLSSLLFSLSESEASPEHAFWGAADATLKGSNDVCIVREQLGRIMAELTVTVSNAPASAKMSGTVDGVATGFYPGSGLSYGSASVTLPSVQAQDGVLQMQSARVMPTSSRETKTRITMEISPSETDPVRIIDIEAPVMEAGGKYEVTIDYRKDFTVVIDSWTEGLIVDPVLPLW